MFRENKAFSSFSVKDIASSKQFYSEVLGLETSAPMDQLLLHLAGGGKVFIYGKDDHQPASFTVLNFPVQNLEETMDALKVNGIEFIIFRNEGFETDERGIFSDDEIKIAWFNDPSGNILSIVEDK